MTDLEIKAADLLLQYGNPDKSMRTTYCLKFEQIPDITPEILNRASLYLKKYEFAKLSEQGVNKMYTLTPDGYDFALTKASFSKILQQEETVKVKQLEKEELDWKHKSLQIEELTFRIKNIEEMQTRQIQFWESGIRRDERQRWQYLLTTMISGAAFIIAVLSLLASILKMK
ncbi:MAG: hypothetical protein H6569_05940 [Lewinellaceae bacterium]|nr:hypothetical protein [Lewinellaceae bacterium]